MSTAWTSTSSTSSRAAISRRPCARAACPPAPTLPGRPTFIYLAARDQLLAEGTERLSLCHWRRHRRERSRYNTMVKSGAVVYPFGCGAGGNFGGLSFMQQRELSAYQQMVSRGEKPIMMMAHQLDEREQRLCDSLVSDLEKGFVDFRRLTMLDSRLEALEYALCGPLPAG